MGTIILARRKSPAIFNLGTFAEILIYILYPIASHLTATMTTEFLRHIYKIKIET